MPRGIRAAALALALGGCVGVPYATPPAQLAVGTGIEALETDGHTRTAPPLTFRAAVHPLGFKPEMVGRPGDFGIGYMLDYSGGPAIQGAYLEGSGALLREPMGSGLGRLSLRAQVRVLFRDLAAGQGAALQLTGEWAKFVEGPYESTDSEGGGFGYAFGESAIGFFVEGAFMRFATGSGWSVTGGLTFRLPASVGFVWKWLWS